MCARLQAGGLARGTAIMACTQLKGIGIIETFYFFAVCYVLLNNKYLKSKIFICKVKNLFKGRLRLFFTEIIFQGFKTTQCKYQGKA